MSSHVCGAHMQPFTPLSSRPPESDRDPGGGRGGDPGAAGAQLGRDRPGKGPQGWAPRGAQLHVGLLTWGRAILCPECAAPTPSWCNGLSGTSAPALHTSVPGTVVTSHCSCPDTSWHGGSATLGRSTAEEWCAVPWGWGRGGRGLQWRPMRPTDRLQPGTAGPRGSIRRYIINAPLSSAGLRGGPGLLAETCSNIQLHFRRAGLGGSFW